MEFFDTAVVVVAVAKVEKIFFWISSRCFTRKSVNRRSLGYKSHCHAAPKNTFTNRFIPVSGYWRSSVQFAVLRESLGSITTNLIFVLRYSDRTLDINRQQPCRDDMIHLPPHLVQKDVYTRYVSLVGNWMNFETTTMVRTVLMMLPSTFSSTCV